ncbi:MAG: hypothetical protein ACLUI3_03060 [Christensenellales bacterium]
MVVIWSPKVGAFICKSSPVAGRKPLRPAYRAKNGRRIRRAVAPSPRRPRIRP